MSNPFHEKEFEMLGTLGTLGIWNKNAKRLD